MHEPEGPATPPADAGEAPRKRGAAELPWVPSRRILGMRVDATSYAETAAVVAELARAGAGGMVFAASVHNAVHALDDPSFRRVMNAAERVTPDGMPLVWALRRLGVSGARRVYGPDLTPVVCARAAELGLAVGFYGGAPDVLGELVQRLEERFPALHVAFAMSPPFREATPEEDRETVAAIEDSGARILFVGLGCPKQERWMAAHRDALPCVLVGVGAAFDFLAGRKAQAPAWLQRAGLEWLFRLLAEPRRLWRRYLIGNPRFAWHFARERALAALGRNGGPRP